MEKDPFSEWKKVPFTEWKKCPFTEWKKGPFTATMAYLVIDVYHLFTIFLKLA